MNSINIQRAATVLAIVLVLAMIASSIAVRNVVVPSLSHPMGIRTSQFGGIQ